MKSSHLVALAMGTLLGGAALAQDAGSADAADTGANLDAAPAASLAGPKGFEVGLRLGYALPMGDLEQGSSFSDLSNGIIPIQLDVGYRFDANWFAGVYFQYGLTGIKLTECDTSGVSCSASDLRFGIEGQYHLMPANALDPWVGLGVGYEIYNFSASAGGVDASGHASGFEFVNATVGADYRVSPNLGVGPYVGLSVGQFSTAGFSAPGMPDQSDSIENKGIHMALSFGLRGVFDAM